MEQKITAEQCALARAACIDAGQNPDSFVDYSDLRKGKKNWEYFLEPVAAKMAPDRLDELIEDTARMRDQIAKCIPVLREVTAEVLSLRAKTAALQRSMQQIANLDPDSFNASAKAVQMAKTALLIPVPK